MVLSLTLDGRGGVKTARSYPLLALESSFSARFSSYRFKVFCPFRQKNSEPDLNRQNTDIVSTAAASTTRAPEHPLRQLDAQFDQRVRIDCGSIRGGRLPEKTATVLEVDLIITTVTHTDRCTPYNRREDNRLEDNQQETVIVNA